MGETESPYGSSKDAIIIAVAPTGGWGPTSNNPVTIEGVSEAVLQAADEGASVVHIHSRDEKGELTPDITAFSQTAAGIRAGSRILLEASTGGLSNMTAEQRCLPVTVPEAEMGSLNIGSLNFGDAVYANSLPSVRYWIQTMQDCGVKPSIEIFDTGHLETACQLIEDGIIHLPCNVSFIFNVKWGMPFDPLLLDFLLSRLPSESRWSAIFVGSTDFSQHLAAVKAGATMVRVGFEDSYVYNGKAAQSNAELVRALRLSLEAEGFTVASADEARKVLLG